MNNTIAYSTITDLALPFDLCCDERMMLCPSCGTELCVFCMDGCDVCGSEIDFTK